MKKHIRVIAIFMIVVALFTGCKSGSLDVRGTFTPLDSSADADSEFYYGGTYENEFFGFKCEFSEEWQIQNPKNHSDEIIAFTGHTKDLTLNINVLKTDKFDKLKDKSAKEMLTFLQEGLIESGIETTDGETYEIELEFLNEQHKAATVKTLPLVEDGRPGATTVLYLKYEYYNVLIQFYTYNEKANDDVIKEFFKSTFHPLDEAVVSGGI